jgi:hypothetical protein
MSEMNGFWTKNRISIFLILLPLFILSCASPQKATDLELVFKKMSESEYTSIIDKNTRRDRQYEGLYNTYELYVTQIKPDVQEALLQREGYYMQWDMAKAQSEREKSLQRMSSSSQFYLSLYTPENQHNDLHKLSSMWKIYLEVNGQRYQGTVERIQRIMVQIQNLYPHHSRFSRGYIVNFAIPMTQLESQKPVFIMTSTLGTSTLSF